MTQFSQCFTKNLRKMGYDKRLLTVSNKLATFSSEQLLYSDQHLIFEQIEWI